ncbi:hypothetical protein AAG906_031203 [Vitis piasezkii]
MAPNVLSPFIAQAQTRHSAIKMDLKEAAATVFDGDLDPRHVISYTTPISSVYTGIKWYYPNIYGFVRSEELVSMHDTSLTRGNLANGDSFQCKTFDARCNCCAFDPYMYAFDGSYRMLLSRVYLPVLFKNHWTLYVYDLHNKRIQDLDSRKKKELYEWNTTKLVKYLLLPNISQGCSIACCQQETNGSLSDLNMYAL